MGLSSWEPDVFVLLRRFLQSPWRAEVRAVRDRLFPRVPIPMRLSFGSWWLAYNDYCGNAILDDRFEIAERRFVEGFLRPEMTVLDIGAHHGLYTLLAARRIGTSGRVVAFEPSLRERKRLSLHLSLNRCTNVQIESCALGSSDGEADFFLVDGWDTGCNSLRPPNVAQPTTVVRVPIKTLDSRLRLQKIDQVDFIKMDVEGAEWGVLKGAVEMLGRRPRPLILCELQEVRTQPWGYRAKEVVEFLRLRDFEWFRLLADGGLEALNVQEENFDGNFVAVPEERLEQIHSRGVGSAERSLSSLGALQGQRK